MDKATFDFAITVPEGITAMANGFLLSHDTTGGKTTWVCARPTRWRRTA